MKGMHMRYFLLVFFLFTVPIFPASAKLALLLNAPNVAELPSHFRSTDHLASVRFPKGVSLEGLGTLNVSGSGQFSEKQWEVMRQSLPQDMIVIDLRQESHGFVNGIAVSWYGFHDWANRFDTNEQAAEAEKVHLEDLKMFSKVDIEQFKLITKEQKINKDAFKLWKQVDVKSVKSEKEVVENSHTQYLRLYLTDHLPPAPADIDRFLELWKTLPAGAWMHFHCLGGVGRTTTFMIFTDILKNGRKVSLKDIIARQVALGSVNFNKTPQDPYKDPFFFKRLKVMEAFYQYVNTTPNLDVKWSDWIKKHPLME
jgi:hypothetical protein